LQGSRKRTKKLEPSQQQQEWQQAVEQAGGKLPSGRIVKDVVQRIIERTRIPNTYQIGEICQILAKDNPELRGKGGCWCEVKVICSRSSEPLVVVTMHFKGLRTSN
jgi:hypothetical protein